MVLLCGNSIIYPQNKSWKESSEVPAKANERVEGKQHSNEKKQVKRVQFVQHDQEQDKIRQDKIRQETIRQDKIR